MRYTPHTEAELAAMLETIGVASIDELFADVPHAHRFPRLDLPEGMSEPEVAALFRHHAGANGALDTHSCFLGAGAYHHYTPALIPHLLFRSELYTAYTPYQPEVSQGTLQTIFEFQTMVARLFGMEVANASLYDGSTALAEAALMAARLRSGRQTVVVSEAVHPEYRQVLATYLSGIGLRIVTVPFDRDTGETDRDALQDALDADTAAVLTQYPNFFGVIEPLAELVEMTHAAGALAVASADPVRGSRSAFRCSTAAPTWACWPPRCATCGRCRGAWRAWRTMPPAGAGSCSPSSRASRISAANARPATSAPTRR